MSARSTPLRICRALSASVFMVHLMVPVGVGGLGSLLPAHAAGGAQPWALMGRHGECADIAVLRRQLPGMPHVATPQAFLQYLDTQGLLHSSQVHAMPGGQAVEVRVPAAGLALLFVTRSQCGAGTPTRP